MTEGLSHLTFVVRDLARSGAMLERVFGARLLYASGTRQFSRSAERFYDIGGVWVAIMEGEPSRGACYTHAAFRVGDAELDARAAEVAALGLEILPARPRIEGEGRSLYFRDADGHLFELHTGTLAERLARYAAEEDAG